MRKLLIAMALAYAIALALIIIPAFPQAYTHVCTETTVAYYKRRSYLWATTEPFTLTYPVSRFVAQDCHGGAR